MPHFRTCSRAFLNDLRMPRTSVNRGTSSWPGSLTEPQEEGIRVSTLSPRRSLYDPSRRAGTGTGRSFLSDAVTASVRVPLLASLLLATIFAAGHVSLVLAASGDEAAGGCPLLSLTLSGSGNDTLLSWDGQPGAQSYCVERGDLLVLRTTGGNFTLSLRQELASRTTETSLLFSGTPGPGEGYWFLVRDNPSGTFDSGCPSQVGSRDNEILNAGDVCVN